MPILIDAIIHIQPQAYRRKAVAGGIAISAKSQKKYQNELRAGVIDALNGRLPKMWEGSISAYYHFGFAPPATQNGRKLSQDEIIAMIGTYHTSRPDIDNLIKSTQDALQGLLFIDDSFIVRTVSSKVWSHKPFVEVKLEGLE